MIIAESGTAWAHKDVQWRKSRLFAYAATAKDAGADYFKVQIFAPNEPLFCPLPGDDKRWERWDDSVLMLSDWQQIKAECEKRGIGFMASAFQRTTVEWLNKLGVDYHKVASRAVQTYPYEKANGEFIISNGMGMKWPDIQCRRLFCLSEYPTKLGSYAAYPGRHDVFSGLSDHSGTPWPAMDALARGAEIVEVHFKLDDDGPDAASSVTVEELKMICDFQKALREMGG